MKKILSLIVITALSVAAVQARSKAKAASDAELKYGFSIGPNVNTLQYLLEGHREALASPTENSRQLIRLHVSFFEEYTLNNAIGLHMAVGYARQGGKYYALEPNNSHEKFRVETILDYIFVSPSVRFYVGTGRNFSLFGGFRINHLIGGKIDLYLDNKRDEEGSTKDLFSSNIKDYKRDSVGIFSGANYEFDNGIMIGFLTYRAISRIAKDKSETSKTVLEKVGEGSTKNTSTEFHIGYNFAKLF